MATPKQINNVADLVEAIDPRADANRSRALIVAARDLGADTVPDHIDSWRRIGVPTWAVSDGRTMTDLDGREYAA